MTLAVISAHNHFIDESDNNRWYIFDFGRIIKIKKNLGQIIVTHEEK
jgi:hypothetical protein